jgi:hypothetical protein
MVVVVFFYLASAVLHLVAFFRLEATFTTAFALRYPNVGHNFR